MRIAVITPAFNAAAYIADAIQSVIVQTHQDWQLVVVDDGSSDATAAIAQSFTDPRVKLIRQANSGVSAARNAGAAVDADAYLFLDADDWLACDALQRLASLLSATPPAVAAVGSYVRVPGHASPVHPRAGARMLARLLVRNCFVNGGHVLVRGRALRAAGPFRQKLRYGEDWEFWVRLALLGPFACDRDANPVLHVRSCAAGAYRQHAADPVSAKPCLEAIFGNPALAERFSPDRLARLRRRAEAEHQWVAGRELVRQGSRTHGLPWLMRSVAAAPSARRLALLGVACAGSLVPTDWRGPFAPYAPQPEVLADTRLNV
ncbi:MAG: glycosyltransferase family 2 protein [Acetobacteraceae bacterium]|nr:glycosyltransferase family 2 protein [Acetobacteraceae bacterium]